MHNLSRPWTDRAEADLIAGGRFIGSRNPQAAWPSVGIPAIPGKEIDDKE